MNELPSKHDQQFDNADSFAQAFDAAWQLHEQNDPDHGLEREHKRALVLQALAEHPFQRSQPELAAQVASFRLRLLGL
ncbi:hypothetical protein KBY96_08610 [Cyanobium sp. ATX 6A2]|uniref:hypothetical protein n=1 Tax=Cyanobium sp. ATX 6A2 TaxID=2823700 RepID=UPI0020CD7AF9|nr:hypothetical protein [Cyanobium sp. ATX 6A2]MCP9887988.1 hypothetical protein [Cyanobium sp. ATX 6A2]